MSNFNRKMVTLRCIVIVLMLSVCSMVANGAPDVTPPVAPDVQQPVKDIERSPRPDLDIQDIRLSLSMGWLDSIDQWFKTALKNGKYAVEQLARGGISILDHMVHFDPVNTVESIFQSAKEVIFALPQEALVYIMDEYCSLTSRAHGFAPFTPDRNLMHIDFVTEGFDKVTTMTTPESICDHPKFRKDWPTVVVTTGWLSASNTTNEALEGLYKAYSKRNVNFMYFDTARYVDTLYLWSAFNTKDIGKILGETLVSLQKCVDPSQLHLIGHSLGAHISGYAARQYHCLTQKLVSRVTGLDPAHPCFREGEAINGLRRGDAAFVDIVHSNCGVLGRRSPIGDVDFYPNGRHPLQPGCLTIICSHSRSWELYAESVVPGNEHNFMATRCDSYSSLKAGNCEGKPIAMGYAVSTASRGDYFLETNGVPPYGMRTPAKPDSDQSC